MQTLSSIMMKIIIGILLLSVACFVQVAPNESNENIFSENLKNESTQNRKSLKEINKIYIENDFVPLKKILISLAGFLGIIFFLMGLIGIKKSAEYGEYVDNSKVPNIKSDFIINSYYEYKKENVYNKNKISNFIKSIKENIKNEESEDLKNKMNKILKEIEDSESILRKNSLLQSENLKIENN